MSYSGKFKDKNNNLHPVTSVLYGTCDTAAATAAKVVTCTDFDTLMTGVTIRVKFANANTAASPTVNINSTGAKSVYRFGSTAPVDGNSWNAGEVVELVYDGTSFFMTGADDIAAKQNATDNSLETEAKTIVGAINEHEGDIGQLKSGLTDLTEEVNGDATTYPYADVITIPDAVPANLADCNVKIEPVQDLHGYDKPWVGGAGKNKLPMTVDGIKAVNTSGTWSGNAYTLNGCTFTVQTDNDGNVIGILVNGTAVRDTEFYVFSDTSNSCPFNGMLINGCINGSNATYDLRVSDITTSSTQQTTGDGEIINVAATGQWRCTIMIRSGYATSNLTFYPMIRLATETDATFAPYTNICPITGHTEASVQRVGVNQWDEDWEQGGIDDTDGSKTSASNQIRSKNYIPCMANTDYYVSAPANTISTYIYYYASDYSFIGRAGQTGAYNVSEKTITTPVNCAYMMMKAGTLTSYGNNISINYPSSITAYTPYVAGKTYTIALGDTIYGGTVDFDSGVMTVDRVCVDAGDLTYNEGSVAFYSSDITDFKRSGSVGNQYATYCISSEFEYHGNSDYEQDANGFSLYYNPSVPGCRLTFNKINFDGYTTTQFKQWLTDNNVQVCYELATPTTIQLTPQQIQLLKGQNTLTASTGQISVTVNGVSGSIGQVQEQANDTNEALAELAADIAEQLPDAPTTDGAYVLTVTVADGTPTYSWESAT